MDEYKIDPIHQKIDDAIWALYNTITKIAEPLSDLEVAELAKHYRTEALPSQLSETGYQMYKEIAEHLEANLVFRIILKKGAEYMERTGEKFYCVACDGACKGHE